MKEFKIEIEDNLKRLDHFLVEQYPEYNRSFIQKLIVQENALVNNEVSRSNYKVKVDDVISVVIPEPESLEILANNIPIDIVYEDDDIAVINKASGMTVHPGAGAYNDTLVNALMYHLKSLSSINGVTRPGIVHRIDKETSGLLVVAKNDKAHLHLSEQLKDKSLNREYIAIVHGQIMDSKIIIDAPIGRDKNDRTKMCITATNSKDAVTNVEVEKVLKDYSIVRCRLETGRTHQIRVHMQYIKHPILGDPKYGYRKDDHSHGQYLHAQKLGLIHPTTNEFMEFSAPLPSYFQEKITELENEN